MPTTNTITLSQEDIVESYIQVLKARIKYLISSKVATTATNAITGDQLSPKAERIKKALIDNGNTYLDLIQKQSTVLLQDDIFSKLDVAVEDILDSVDSFLGNIRDSGYQI